MATDQTPHPVPSREYAEQVTNELRDVLAEYVRVTGRAMTLVQQARDGRVWEVLGFDGWETYVNEALGMSRMQAWRLIQQAEITAQLTEAAGVEVPVSARAAEDLRPVMGDVIDAVKDATAGKPPAERKAAAEREVSKARKAKAAKVIDVPATKVERRPGVADLPMRTAEPGEALPEIEVRTGPPCPCCGGSGIETGEARTVPATAAHLTRVPPRAKTAQAHDRCPTCAAFTYFAGNGRRACRTCGWTGPV